MESNWKYIIVIATVVVAGIVAVLRPDIKIEALGAVVIGVVFLTFILGDGI